MRVCLELTILTDITRLHSTHTIINIHEQETPQAEERGSTGY